MHSFQCVESQPLISSKDLLKCTMDGMHNVNLEIELSLFRNSLYYPQTSIYLN